MNYHYLKWLPLIGISSIIVMNYYAIPKLSKWNNTNFNRPKMQNAMRAKIFQSRWTQYFPHIKDSLIRIQSEWNLSAITNASRTVLTITNPHSLEVGDVLRASIIAYNEVGERKKYGGDFFLVLLRRPNSEIDGVTCPITDNMDGSYSVICILPWEGEAIIKVTLVHPFEAILQIMKNTSYEKPWGLILKTKMLNSHNQTEYTPCAVGFHDKRPDELCDYSNPTHGEKRTCIKPLSGECSKIIGQERVELKSEINVLESPFCQQNYNLEVPITGSGETFYVRVGGNSSEYFSGNISGCNTDPMIPSGWILNSAWMSIKTKRYFSVSMKTMAKCLSDKRIHIFGDSTGRQIYSYFQKKLKFTDYGLDNSHFWSRGRDADVKSLNLTFQYRSHGPPLNNPGPEDARPYMSDSFDAIRDGGKGTIVIFTIGYHFEFYDPDVYLSRLKIIKRAVLSLLSRLPGTRVIAKGLHYKTIKKSWRSSWLTYRLETIFRHVFRDIEEVLYMETWDINLLLNNEGIHPPTRILTQTIQLLLAYIC